jgi:hypothetical protein
MVITTNLLDLAKNTALSELQNYSYMAVGEGLDVENPASTALSSEIERKQGVITNDSGAGTTEIVTTYSLSEAVGTITEVGVFDTSSLGNLAYRKLLNEAIEKDDSFELEITMTTTTSVVNG